MEHCGVVLFAVPMVATVAIAATTLVYLIQFNKRVSCGRGAGNEGVANLLYQDEDGAATEETVAKYSAGIQKWLILFGSFIGFGFSLAVAVRTTSLGLQNTEIPQSWLYSVSWGCTFLCGICIHFERAHRQVFGAAVRLFIVSSILLAAHSSYILIESFSDERPSLFDLGLVGGQIAAASSIAISALVVPRRPEIFHQGQKVDGMRTVSMFSRYTFEWATMVLGQAAQDSLEEDDLPALDIRRRSGYLQKAFNDVGESPKLHYQIIRVYWKIIAQQWILTLGSCLASFSPHFAMYKILKLLEKRNIGDSSVQYEIWIWIFGLGLIKMIQTFVQQYLYWVSFTNLMVPIRSQLSAIIFSKTMRKKDVKGSQKGKEDNDLGDDARPKKNMGSVDHVGDDDLKNMKQGTINLLAIDSTRIAEFMAWGNVYGETLFSLIIGITLLVSILGWESLLAGLMVVFITTPLNIMVSRKYAAAQDAVMKARDRKMAVVSEALQGIRQIKFSASEAEWESRIKRARDEELRGLRIAYVTQSVLISFWIINSVMFSAVALAAYSIINGTLSPSVAFTAKSIFNELEFVLSVVPELTTDLLDCYVSSLRIKDYLNSAEKKPNITESTRIRIGNATIAWAADSDDKNDRFCLVDVNLEFPINELSIISGRTGSGKSLLLAALVDEADLLSGSIEMPKPPAPEERFDSKATPVNWIIPSAVAFVAQIPWIENATIRDNILFGLPYHESRYRQTVYACALEKDLEMLEDGEMTEIGANGINLSGGQRWRVSFARAIYSRAGILILDDIFSAVDAHVGKHIYENGLTGELMDNRTRILVTHHIKLCIPKAKYTVLLSNGTVERAGLVEDLLLDSSLDKLMSEDLEQCAQVIEEEPTGLEAEMSIITRQESITRRASRSQTSPKKFVQDEKHEKGAVGRKVYAEYLNSSGGPSFWIITISLFILSECIWLGSSWWIKLWTSRNTELLTAELEKPLLAYSLQRISMVIQKNESLAYWIGIYSAFSILGCLIDAAKYFWIFLGSLRASKVLFEKMTSAVLRAPLRWLDTVPTGRILNRFAKDFEIVDSKLVNNISFLIFNGLGLIGVIVAGLFVSPWMLLAAVILLSLNLKYAIFYMKGARKIKRLESNSRSPIFELFGSTLNGVRTVRAFGKAQEYTEKMFSKIDAYGQHTFYVWLLSRWLSLRMSIIGGIFTVVVACIVVALPNIDPSLAGFALSFSLGYSVNIIWAVRRYADTELNMNSTERIAEYTRLPTEDTGGILPPASWPSEGSLEVNDLVVSYAPDLPPVLKGISFKVNSMERVGVVGRTGAGKSSLTLALFRFVQASSGSIYIDGIDISKVSLQDLRSRVAIIPQDPVLFSGTIRSNLDAFDQHSDRELRDALERVHLIQSSSDSSNSSVDGNSNIFESLDSKISEGGLNLSQGQRQLLCLARAIVSRPKILVLDEATSAVDMETDSLIQKSIREEFNDCTTLVIAHRLQTVADYDRLLVLGDGKVLEYDSPWNLLQAKGVFYEMAQQTGESEALEIIARRAAGA